MRPILNHCCYCRCNPMKACNIDTESSLNMCRLEVALLHKDRLRCEGVICVRAAACGSTIGEAASSPDG